MKIAVVYFSENNGQRIAKIAEGVKKGIESQGHQVDLINGNKEEGKKLTVYKYIVVGAEASLSFRGKIPDIATRFISNAGMLSNKDAFAFVSSTILGNRKALLKLMKIMEHAGMMITASEFFNNSDEAEEISKRLHIE